MGRVKYKLPKVCTEAFERYPLHGTQKGVTLLSLMFGMALSSISMLACLSMYIQHFGSALESKKSSEYNSHVTHSMLILHKEISSAGFGLVTSANAHIDIDTSQTSQSSLLWRYWGGSATVCRGIREVQSTLDDEAYTSLRFLRADTGCDSSENLITMDWIEEADFARWINDDVIESYLNDASNVNGTLFDFQLSAAPIPCMPYNSIDAANMLPHLKALVSAPTSAQLHGNDSVNSANLDICLPNL